MSIKGIKNNLGAGLGEFMRRLDWDERVLAFGSLVRVFTLGQAARLVWEGEIRAAQPALERLVLRHGLLGKLEGIELPKGCGSGKADVYYLTAKGASRLSAKAVSIANHAQPGRPRGANRARIPHELLVAEAFLWLNDRFEIYEFWPESELKRRIGQARARREGRFIKGAGNEATGDFKALVIKRGEQEEERWIHGEVVVKYKSHQIDAKLDELAWFARDPLQVDIVEYLTGQRPVILPDVRLPLDAHYLDSKGALRREPMRRVPIKPGVLERRVLAALDAIGGMATAEALAFILDQYRTHMSHALKLLEARGEVRSEEAQLVPGSDTGRPMRLYVRGGMRIGSVWEKINALVRSRMMLEMAILGYRLFSYDGNKDEMEFRDRTVAKNPSLVVVIDDRREPVDRLVEQMIRVRERGVWPVAAVTSATRAACLQEMLAGRIEKVLVSNVVEGRETKPREVSERQQRAAVRAASVLPNREGGSLSKLHQASTDSISWVPTANSKGIGEGL